MHPTPRYLLLLVVGLLAPTWLRAADEAAESEVRRLDAMRVTALLHADFPALEKLYSDQLVYIHAAGRIDTKTGYLGMLKAGDLTYVSITYDPPAQIRVSGDTAVVTGKASIETKNKSGQITKRVLTTTTVYARTGKGWNVVSYQGTPNT